MRSPPRNCCSGCGESNRSGAKFCRKCGQVLAPAPPAEGVSPPAQEFDYWRAFSDQGHYEATDAQGSPQHLTRVIADDAIAFLDARPRDRPFVLSIGFKAPHVQDGDPRQFIPDPVDTALYEGITIPAPATADELYWLAQPEFFRTDNEARHRWYALFSTPEQYQASVKGYYRLVTGMDRMVGEIRAALRRLNLDRNSVIIFISDNGFYLGELGLSHKWYGHDPSIRVPLVIYDPRLPTVARGRVESAIALNIDLAPTLLDMAGESIPAGMQGRSLLPLLRGERMTWRTDFLFEHMFAPPRIKCWRLGVQDLRLRFRRSALGMGWIFIQLAVTVVALGAVYGNLLGQDMRTFLPFLAVGLILWGLITASVVEGSQAFVARRLYQADRPPDPGVRVSLLREHCRRGHGQPILLYIGRRRLRGPDRLGDPVGRSRVLPARGDRLLARPDLCPLTARFRDTTHLASTALQILFFVTPVIWPPEMLKGRPLPWVVDDNPLYHLLEVVRRPLLFSEPPTPANYLVGSGVVVGLGVLAFLVVRLYSRRIVYLL